MTGLDYVGLLFCELFQLTKQAAAEVKAKYGLHETQLRNMPMVGFANVSTVENRGRWKELMHLSCAGPRQPRELPQAEESKPWSAFSQRNQSLLLRR